DRGPAAQAGGRTEEEQRLFHHAGSQGEEDLLARRGIRPLKARGVWRRLAAVLADDCGCGRATDVGGGRQRVIASPAEPGAQGPARPISRTLAADGPCLRFGFSVSRVGVVLALGPTVLPELGIPIASGSELVPA